MELLGKLRALPAAVPWPWPDAKGLGQPGPLLATFVATQLGCLVILKRGRLDWHVSFIHAIVACVMASASLAAAEDRVLGLHTITLSLSYFLFDLALELRKRPRNWGFVAHHIVSMAAGLAVLVVETPMRVIFLCMLLNEASTPFLYLWRECSMAWAKGAFVVLFFALRVVLNAFFLRDAYARIGDRYDAVCFALGIAFYGVQLLWAARIVQIACYVLRGDKRPPKQPRAAAPHAKAE
jgi:uncharacterized membrane protein YfcA